MTMRKGETGAEFYARTKGQAAARMREWLADHPGRGAEYSRRWKLMNPEKARENPEKARARGKRWRAANLDHERERARLYAREWRSRNREHVNAYAQSLRERDRERIQARDRRRAQTEGRKISRQAGHHTRKARQRGAPGKHTAAEWRARLAQFGGRCAWCGADGKMTCDHLRPLARGGSNLIDNVVPACMRCNASKSHADPGAWILRRIKAGKPVTPFALGVAST